MSVLHASTSLLRSPSQFRQLVKKVKEVSHDNLLLFSLSHNSPDLENSVKELSSAARETIGCLSAPLPLRDRNPFFSCSVAVFPKEICVPFSVDKAGLPPTQIGRWHSYAGGKPVDDGIAANDDVGVWGEIWGMNDSTQFLPDELRGTRYLCRCHHRTLVKLILSSAWTRLSTFRIIQLLSSLHPFILVSKAHTKFVNPIPLVSNQC